MVIQMNKVAVPSDTLGLHNTHHLMTGLGLTPQMMVDSRDPFALNGHIQASWNNVVGEPEGLRSPEWAWKFSTEIFTFVQAATYRFLVVILGPILAFLGALFFGILHFLQIWFLRPILKWFHLIFSFTRSFIEVTLQGSIGPVIEIFGTVLSKVKVKHQRVYDAKDEPNFPFII